MRFPCRLHPIRGSPHVSSTADEERSRRSTEDFSTSTEPLGSAKKIRAIKVGNVFRVDPAEIERFKKRFTT